MNAITLKTQEHDIVDHRDAKKRKPRWSPASQTDQDLALSSITLVYDVMLLCIQSVIPLRNLHAVVSHSPAGLALPLHVPHVKTSIRHN